MNRISKTIQCAAWLAVAALMLSPDAGFCSHCVVAGPPTSVSGPDSCAVFAGSGCCAALGVDQTDLSDPLTGDCGGRCGCCQELPTDRSPASPRVPPSVDFGMLAEKPVERLNTSVSGGCQDAICPNISDVSRQNLLCVWLI